MQGELNKREAPLPDSSLLATGVTKPLSLPAADGSALPGVPAAAVPSVIQVHDFLSRFSNTLLLTPCPLDDFAAALRCGASPQPPYVSEAIVAMLKLLFSDPFAKEFWKAEGTFRARGKAPDPDDAVMADADGAGGDKDDYDDNDTVGTTETEVRATERGAKRRIHIPSFTPSHGNSLHSLSLTPPPSLVSGRR